MKGNTGELIFYKAYEDVFNVKLTSSFLSAIFSFVKQTLKTEELSEIEVGLFRFIFEIEKIKQDELLFALFSDRTDNLVELRNQLREIKNQFMNRFDLNLLTDNYNGEISKFLDFEKNIHSIMENGNQLVSEDLKNDLMNIFNELHTFSSFVVSSALLTQTGRVIVSNLEQDILQEIVRLLEGRFLSGNYRVNELISLEKFGVLSLIGIDKHFISVILFKSNCPFETGLVISKRFSNRLQKLIC
ncbi:MAG: hypothetical protein ACFFA0_09520 [Promethearchaeota archaeon]